MTPQERTDKLTKDVSLTKEQQPKVLAIFTAMQDSSKGVFEAHQGDREAMRPLMQKIRQDADNQLKNVLTTEQYDLMMKLRAEAPGRQGGDRQRPAPAPDGAKAPEAKPTPPPVPEKAPAPEPSK